MPHHGINTQLTPEQMQLLRKAKEKTGKSYYKLLREGVLIYCEELLKEKKPDEREKNGSGTKGIRQETIRVSY